MSIDINGVSLPDIPEGLLDTYPYYVISKLDIMDESDEEGNAIDYTKYAILASVTELSVVAEEIVRTEFHEVLIGKLIIPKNLSGVIYTYTPDKDTEWTLLEESIFYGINMINTIIEQEGEEAGIGFNLNKEYPYLPFESTMNINGSTIYSNHDVYLADSMSESAITITDKVCILDSDVEYPKNLSITGEWIEKLANEVRRMTSNINRYSIDELLQHMINIHNPVGSYWKQANIELTGKIGCIVYGNKTWVMGTETNGIYYSTDGINWIHSNITTGRSYHIHFVNNMWFVSNKEDDATYYSTDGKKWYITNLSNIGSDITNVVYGNGVYVMDCYSHTLYYSTDGKSWYKCTSTNSNISSNVYSRHGLSYINNIFISHKSSLDVSGLMYSEDGKTWVQSNIESGSGNVVYANGIYVAGLSDYDDVNNGIFYSTDGKTWTLSNVNYDTYDVKYANYKWVATTSNGIYYSTDGIEWILCTIVYELLSTEFYNVAYVNETWIACAGGYNYIMYPNSEGEYETAPTGGIYYSNDGITWIGSNVSTSIMAGQLACTNNICIAATNASGLVYSTDGKTWIRTNIPLNMNFINSYEDNIVYGNGMWVAHGKNANNDNKPCVWYSTI